MPDSLIRCGARRLTLALLFALHFAGRAVPVAAQVPPRSASPAERLEFQRRQHEELRKKLVDSLETVARFCDEKNLRPEAAEIRKLAEPVDEAALDSEPLPTRVQPEIRLDVPPDERFWRTQSRHARQTYAKDLYLLARRVINAGFPSYAYQLILEVARHDPDHKSARQLLGQVRDGDEWITPFERTMRTKSVEHEKFGWLLKTHVDRYEGGERYFGGRWIPAAQEAEIRRDFRNAWEARTEHYLVKTNHSLEQGVQVARWLERFHEFFFRTSAAFFDSPEEMQKLFDGGTRGRPKLAKPYVVHYYRTRDEYNQALVAKIPQIGITNGLYYTSDRTAYFHHDDEVDGRPVLYHEATHQILYESQARDRLIGEQAHFWIIEGIACYMESFEDDGRRIRLGNPDYVRFDAARYRYLHDEHYVPLARFAARGMRDFQSDPNIAKNYSQASGLAHFFMHYDGARYRDALVRHLSQLYEGDDPSNPRAPRKQTLAELTGVSNADLDRQYGEHLRRLEADAERRRAGTTNGPRPN